MYQATAAIAALHGIVKTHAQTIVPAIPQRTADNRLVAPTPTIAPVIVCVVGDGDSERRGEKQRGRTTGLRTNRRPAAVW